MLSAEITSMREAELVSLAQAGDDRAFTMLVAVYEPMLRAQVSHFHFPSAEADDMAQEGLLGLLAAVRSFDPSRDVSFRTYASACVRNRLLSLLRRGAARAAEVPVEDVTAVNGVTEDFATDPAALMQERETAADMLRRIKQVLSPCEYGVLLRYLDGYSYTAIAAQLQMPAKAVDNALQRARAKLRKSL